MKFTYTRINYRGEASAEVTGTEERAAVLTVPGELGGFPVRSIGKGAFQDRADIEEVTLPDSVRRIGGFAFYGCPRLARINMTDGADDVGDGVIRSVKSLEVIRIAMRRGNYRVMRDLLADTDRELRIHLTLEDGEAELFFPAYVNDFDEDTMARAIHPRIEGCGYAFREAVSRGGIDYRNYDAQFPRTAAEGFRVAGEIALSRLLFPYRLTDEARKAYEAALLRYSGELLPYLAGAGRAAEIALMSGRELMVPEAAEIALEGASAARQTEICGILMEYLRKKRGGRPAPRTSFSL